MIDPLLLLLVVSASSRSSAFNAANSFYNPGPKIVASRPNRLPFAIHAHEHFAGDGEPASLAPAEIELEAYSSTGIPSSSGELPQVLEAISSVCEEYGIPFDTSNLKVSDSPSQCGSIPGILGRVLLLRIKGVPAGFDVDQDEFLAQLKVESSQRIDTLLYNDEEACNQPILLAIRPEGGDISMEDMIEKEVMDYGLRDGMDAINDEDIIKRKKDGTTYIPSLHIEMDGAMVETIGSPGQTHFDTSDVLVFDNLLDDSLMQRLLNVVKGYPDDTAIADQDWDDAENGPDPSRWIRGGLMDVPDENETTNENEGQDDASCWGLSDDAIMDICFSDHPAIQEFESRLAQLFPEFVVTRLPEAVLGECVSPLTANAPTHGDTFDFHIDADPLQVPPSPWADVFGRYPNRSSGKPRFVSCLLYLNSEWDADAWGAPTRFLDPPTQQTYEVYPEPGRCVFMDQDISHTVVAPNANAGKRPRYSLVWKLILHPKMEDQDMDLSCGRKESWPEAVVIGSADK